MLISVADAGVVFAVGAGAMLVAALFFSLVRVEGRALVASPDRSESPRDLLVAGIGYLARSPGLRVVVGLVAAQAFVRGCLNVLIVVAAFQVLDANASAVGYMTAAVGAGGLLGALGAFTLGGRRLAVVFGGALVFWGLPIALMAPSTFLVTALLLLAVVGAANSIEDVAAFTLLQRIVPDHLLARVMGAIWGLAMGAVALGSIFAPAVVSLLGPEAALVIVGMILPVLVLLAWRRLRRGRPRSAPPHGPAGVDRLRSDVRAAFPGGERMSRDVARADAHPGG